MRRVSPLGLAALLTAACAGPAGQDGANGKDGSNCTVERDAETGTTTITCADGTTAEISDGADGEDGDDGEDGEDGTSCTAERLPTGDYEVTCPDGTSFVVDDPEACDLAAIGTLRVFSAEDLEPARGCRVLLGSLELYSVPEDLSALESVEEIVGRVEVIPEQETSFTLPGVRLISAGVYVESETLQTLSFPALEHVGHLEIDEAGALQSLSAPQLRSIASALGVADTPSLTQLDLPLLEAVDGLYLYRSDALTALTFPALTFARDIRLESNNALEQVSFPAMETLGAFDLYRNPALTRVTVSATTTVDDLYVVENEALETLRVPVTESLDHVQIRVNPALTTLDLGTPSQARQIYLRDLAALPSAGFLASVQETSRLEIERVPALTSLSLASLTRVETDLRLYHLTALTSVEFSADLVIEGSFYVYEVPQLPFCAFPLGAARVGASSGGLLPSDGSFCDNCPDVENADQRDTDDDGEGDACDADIDGDTLANDADPVPDVGRRCGDADADGCDDCSLLGIPSPAQDGIDDDGDGACERSVPLPLSGHDPCRPVDDSHVLFCDFNTSFDGAIEQCGLRGGQLFEPRTEADLTFIHDHPEMGNRWLGITDAAVEGTWVYASDGTELTFTPPWANGEPNNAGNEDCAQTYGYNASLQAVQWNDGLCHNGFRFACGPAPAAPVID